MATFVWSGGVRIGRKIASNPITRVEGHGRRGMGRMVGGGPSGRSLGVDVGGDIQMRRKPSRAYGGWRGGSGSGGRAGGSRSRASVYLRSASVFRVARPQHLAIDLFRHVVENDRAHVKVSFGAYLVLCVSRGWSARNALSCSHGSWTGDQRQEKRERGGAGGLHSMTISLDRATGPERESSSTPADLKGFDHQKAPIRAIAVKKTGPVE